MRNDKLTIDSEDWLLDVIDKFMSKGEKENSDGLSDVYFYEEINFDFLSEDKLKEFIEKVNPNEMTASLWNKIKKCFYFNMKTSHQKSSESNKRDGNGFYRHRIHYAKSVVVGGWDEYR